MSRLLVLTGVEVEARGLARELGLARVVSGGAPRFAGAGIEVRPVGLRAGGPGARGLWEGAPPRLLVSAGTCGALSPALGAVGALVVPRAVLAASGAWLPIDPAAHARALEAAARAGRAAVTDPLLTADAVVASPAEKAVLWRRTGAVAVDMESAILLEQADRRGVPAVVIRAVCDTATQSLPPELADLVDDAGRARTGRTAALVLRRPALIGSALALRRATGRALEAVASVLAELRS